MLGIFDSGLGGLTVVRELRSRLPNIAMLYFGDTARVPYGSKGNATIKKYAQQDTEWLLENGADVIVVACHTAASIAGADLHSYYQDEIPIYDVVEPGINKALETTNGKIGIIGTRGTINSGIHERLLMQERGLMVSSQACPLFVPLAEEGFSDRPESLAIVRYYLAPLLEREIDTLVLACTHYPLLRKQIAEVCGPGINIVDPAEALADQVLKDVQQEEHLERGGLDIVLSDQSHVASNLVKAFFGRQQAFRVELGAPVDKTAQILHTNSI